MFPVWSSGSVSIRRLITGSTSGWTISDTAPREGWSSGNTPFFPPPMTRLL